MVTMKCTHGTVDWRYCNDCCHVLALEVPALRDLLSRVTQERDEARRQLAAVGGYKAWTLDRAALYERAEKAEADAALLRIALENAEPIEAERDLLRAEVERHREVVRRVAERQREACAYVFDEEACVRVVLATPLVTEEEP